MNANEQKQIKIVDIELKPDQVKELQDLQKEIEFDSDSVERGKEQFKSALIAQIYPDENRIKVVYLPHATAHKLNAKFNEIINK